MAQRVTLVAFGGFDPTGGAGLTVDAETARALQCDMRLVLCARTAQGSATVRVWPTSARERDQVLACLPEVAGLVAVKTGAVGRIDHLLAALAFARHHTAPTVVDPVARTTGGAWLWPGLEPRAWATELRRQVLPVATVVTPNWIELPLLLGAPAPTDLPSAEALLRQLPCAAVLKGGHAPGDLLGVDLVCDGRRVYLLPKWLEWKENLRGSGCRLATALAIHLARGMCLLDATKAAGQFVHLQSQRLSPESRPGT